jgi:Zn-dependent M28 family amino/carboxypeptidase
MRSQAIIVLTALCVNALWAAPEFSGERALEYTRKAVAFGPRPPGSPALKQLQAYLLTQIRAHGAAVTTDDFTASTPKGPIAMRNIVARFAGKSGKAIVLSGHYDTAFAPKGADGTHYQKGFLGANDAGSSTGFLLEMLDVLQGAPRQDDIWLVWLDGEEAVVDWTDTDSLYGSRHLAQKWLSDGTAAKVKALINIDMIGDKNLDLVYDLNSTPVLRDLVWQSAQRLGFQANFTHNSTEMNDDHQPFIRAGIRALDLIDFDYGPDNSWWHNDKDTMDKLSANSFRIVGKVVQDVIPQLEAWR